MVPRATRVSSSVSSHVVWSSRMLHYQYYKFVGNGRGTMRHLLHLSHNTQCKIYSSSLISYTVLSTPRISLLLETICTSSSRLCFFRPRLLLLLLISLTDDNVRRLHERLPFAFYINVLLFSCFTCITVWGSAGNVVDDDDDNVLVIIVSSAVDERLSVMVIIECVSVSLIRSGRLEWTSRSAMHLSS